MAAWPSPDNWTLGTSERAIKRLHGLYGRYERLAEFDEVGNQVNAKAEQVYREGEILQGQIPVDHIAILNYRKLFT